MNSEKVKEIKKDIEICTSRIECEECSLIPIMTSTNCRNELLKNCLTLINELESENEKLIAEKQKVLEYMKTDNYAKLKKEDMYWGYQMGIGMLEHEINRQKDRIAELEKENKDYYDRLNNLQTYIDNHEEIWKGNTNNALKQFAERLKEKCEWNRKQYCCSATVSVIDIDETLEECIK